MTLIGKSEIYDGMVRGAAVVPVDAGWLLVDDGPVDRPGPPQLPADCTVIRHPVALSTVAAWNIGLARATGDILFLCEGGSVQPEQVIDACAARRAGGIDLRIADPMMALVDLRARIGQPRAGRPSPFPVLPLPDGSAPSLSIVIPTYRRPDLAARLLRLLMPQAHALGVEVVLVNDGSHDPHYAAAVAPYGDGLRYEVLDRNVGRGAATNHGIACARGEWIAFADDDIWPPEDWIAGLLAIVRRHPGLDAVGGTTRAIRHAAPAVVERFTIRRAIYVPQPHFTAGTLKCLVTACLAVRRETLARVGGMDGRFPCGQDHNLTWRLRRAGAAIHVTHDWWCGHDQNWSLRDFTGRLREYGYWHVVQSGISGDPVDYAADPATSLRQLARRLPRILRRITSAADYHGLAWGDALRFRLLDLAAFFAWNGGGIAAARRDMA